jgi:hypothetical protein
MPKIVTTLLCGAVLMLAPPASASRPANRVERADITTAVQAFFSQWYYGSQSKTVHVHGVRVSSADPDWAVASVSGPTARGRFPLTGPYQVVLLWHATGGPHSHGEGPGGRRWIVTEAGVGMGEYFGCGIAPPRVTSDLLRSTNGGC